MDRMRVLITSPPFLAVADKYEWEFRLRSIEVIMKKPPQYFREAEMKELICDVDGIICGDDEITRDVLKNANRLRVISKWGVGIDSIDLHAAEEMGIPVCNSPGAFSDACADVAMGYLIMLARNLHTCHSLVMRGKWQKVPGLLLRGRSAGIIGVGRIGREIAKRAISFGLNVYGNDIRSMPPSFINETNIVMMERDDLLARSDFVLISCDLNSRSRGMINERALSIMKPSSYLINIARGPIVDTRALIEALRDERIAGAAFDVFDKEPLSTDSPLRLFDNCILGSHNAYNADVAVEHVHSSTVRNLLKHLFRIEPESLDETLNDVFRQSTTAAMGETHVF